MVSETATAEYYAKFFAAELVEFKEKQAALYTGNCYLFMEPAETSPSTNEGSCLWHIGWSGVDGPFEYNWRVQKGIKVHTEITPLGDDYWMYFWGPNNEVVEVFTGNRNSSFEHIHLLATDVDETVEWFAKYLGLKSATARSQPWGNGLFKWNYLSVGDINIYVFGQPVEERAWFPKLFKPTEGTAIDHIGFVVDNIRIVLDRMLAHDLEITKGIEKDEVYGIESFFVRAPDGLLVEVLQECERDNRSC